MEISCAYALFYCLLFYCLGLLETIWKFDLSTTTKHNSHIRLRRSIQVVTPVVSDVLEGREWG